MNITSLTLNIKILAGIGALLLIASASVAIAGGGGGGGGSATGPGVSINGSIAGTATNGAVSNISVNQGTISGTFNGISVGFNQSTGQWEGSYSVDGPGSGGTGVSTCSGGCTYVPPPPTPLAPNDPTGLGHYCSADGTSVTLRWNPAAVSQRTEPKVNPFTREGFLMTRVAHAEGGSGEYMPGGGLGGPSSDSVKPGAYNNAPITYPVIVGQNGTFDSPVYTNEISGTSVSVPITPGTTYPWRVRACRGGACGNWQNSSFRCDPPPQLDLQANPTTVRYDNPSTLTWTSSWTAPTCQAQFGWSGNRPNQNTSGESTGNLITNTSYRLICPAQFDFSPAIDDATVSVISCVSGAKVATSKNLVRKGETVTLSYNTGAANPAQCTLKAGPVILVDNLADNGDRSASCTDGSAATDRTYTYEVNGEVDITWECEGQLIDTLRIRVLPEFQET